LCCIDVLNCKNNKKHQYLQYKIGNPHHKKATWRQMAEFYRNFLKLMNEQVARAQ
jgi:hypothetical protein